MGDLDSELRTTGPALDVARLVRVFTLVVTVLTAVLFWLLPALSLTRGDVAGAVRSGRSGYGRRARRVWRAVLGVEIAMAVILLVSGGLLVRSLDQILARDGGFRILRVVTGWFEMPLGKYETAAEAVGVIDEVLGGLRTSPGVGSAGLSLLLPVPDADRGRRRADGRSAPVSGR